MTHGTDQSFGVIELKQLLARLIHAHGEVKTNGHEHITSLFVPDGLGGPDLGFLLGFERDAALRGTYLTLIEIQETE